MGKKEPESVVDRSGEWSGELALIAALEIAGDLASVKALERETLLCEWDGPRASLSSMLSLPGLLWLSFAITVPAVVEVVLLNELGAML